MSYQYSLLPSSYNDEIDGIRIQWRDIAIERLRENAITLGVPFETLKALSEHFSYLLARRLQSALARIM